MKLDKRGKQYLKPIIDTREALESRSPGETVEVLVDNEIAIQDLNRVVTSRGLSAVPKKMGDNEFSVKIAIGQGVTPTSGAVDNSGEEPVACQSDSREKGMTVVLSFNFMGRGNPGLGEALMKGFVYVLTQQDALSETIFLYNSDAYLSYEGSDNLEDLKSLEFQEVEILTCRTRLNFYGLGEEFQAGSVTNMYEIMERMAVSKLLVCP